MTPHVAVTGIAGHVGGALGRYRPEGIQLTGLVHRSTPSADGLAGVITGFDITVERVVREAVRTLALKGVRTIINCAGQVALDAVESERYADDPTTRSAFQANARGAELLADACAAVAAEGRPILLLQLSSESVFADNMVGIAYTEEDTPSIPRHHNGAIDYTDTGAMPTMYGLTKALGELAVLEKYREGSVVVRMHGVQGPRGCLFARTASALCQGESFTRVDDMHVAHLTDATVVKALLTIEDAMHDPARRTRGIYHLSARTTCTPYEIALRFADAFKTSRTAVTPIGLAELIESSRTSDRPMAPRPHYTILGVSQFEQDFFRLPTAEEAIAHYLDLYGHLFRDPVSPPTP